MGHAQSHYPEYRDLQPGTYRIVSGVAHTALEVSTFGHHKVEAWEIREGDHQKWLLQRSGDGYRFQNLGFCGSEETITCAIQYPDANRILDLHFGNANNGNKVTLQPGDELMCKTWKLVRLKGVEPTFNKTSEEYEKEIRPLKQQIDARDEVLVQYAKTTEELRDKCNTNGNKRMEECKWVTHKMTYLNLKATKFEYTRIKRQLDGEQDGDDEDEDDYEAQEKHYEL